MAVKKKTAAKKTTAKKSTSKKKAPTEMLLVGSKTKEVLKSHDLNVAGDALDGLNGLVHWYLQQAADRAKENGRKTVRSHDFMV